MQGAQLEGTQANCYPNVEDLKPVKVMETHRPSSLILDGFQLLVIAAYLYAGPYTCIALLCLQFKCMSTMAY